MTEAVAGMVDLQAQYRMPIIGKIISTMTTFFGMKMESSEIQVNRTVLNPTPSMAERARPFHSRVHISSIIRTFTLEIYSGTTVIAQNKTPLGHRFARKKGSYFDSMLS